MAYNANIGVARAEFFPSISLTGMMGTIASSVGNSLYRAGRGMELRRFRIAPNYRLRAQLVQPPRTREAQKRAAIATYRKTVQSAFQDIRNSLTAQREADSIVNSMQIQVDSLRRATDLARLQYDNGYTDYLDRA